MAPKKKGNQTVDDKKVTRKTTVLESSDSEDSEVDIMEEKIEKVMKKVMNEFKKEIKKELQEFEKSLSFTSGKMEEMLEEMKELKKRQVSLENENEMLKEKVRKMEISVEDLEQYSRNRNIEINGIPFTKDENLEKIVKDIGIDINVEIKDGEIDVVHRIPTRNNKNPEPVVVQFLSRKKRDEMIQKAKDKQITTTTLNMSGPQRTIYINEHLTKQRKRLLYETKQKKKEMAYKFVWTKGGKVFLRKNETSNVIQVRTFEELDYIK